MLSNTNALRGRNVEDIGDLEEKGLLRHASDDNLSGSGSGRLEKLEIEEKYEPGLKSKRDQQAFALLVVLCASPSPYLYSCSAHTRPPPRRPPWPDVRHPPLPAQAAAELLGARRLRAQHVALLAEAVMEPGGRLVVRAQVGKAQVVDRAGAGYCGDGVVSPRRAG